MRQVSWLCVIVVALAQNAVAAPRHALVIGNDSYPGNALRNARNDARAVSGELIGMGYLTDLVLDVNRMQLALAVEHFVETIRPGDTVLVYYAGHGLQVQGENYLVPTDFKVSDEVGVSHQGYPLSRILDKLIARGSTTQIVILDACRNNPFLSSRSIRGGWADMSTSAGTFLAYGTAPGSTASDDPSADHGLFTMSLLKLMNTSPLDVEKMFGKVREEVVMSSGGQQVPWTASSLIGTLHMIPQDDGDRTQVTALSTLGKTVGRRLGRDERERSMSAGDAGNDHRLSMVSEAIDDIRSLRVASAISILDDVLSLFPTYVPALRLLGVALHLSGRSVEAEQALTSAIQADPQDARAYAYRCLVQTGRNTQAALSDCRTAIGLDESLSQAHIGLALNLSILGRDKEAVSEMSKALILDKAQVDSLMPSQ